MSMIIMRSDRTWTITRFLAPRDGAAKQRLRSGFFGTDTIGWTITRADIAHFLSTTSATSTPHQRSAIKESTQWSQGTVRPSPRPEAEPFGGLSRR